MRWNQGNDSPNVEDRRSEGGAGLGGGGGGLPLGGILAIAARFGWKGVLLALVVIGALMYGGNLCGGSSTSHQQVAQRSDTDPAQDKLVHFVGFVLDDVNKTWHTDLPNYTDTRVVVFRNAIASACGTARTAVGPFYCPIDRKVYIDLAFYDELRRRFGAPGDFAQAYVIAHEIGHHVQNLRGLLGKGEVSSVPIELQADCLAGAWAKSADKRGLLEVGDIDEALNAASQIGDDTIQRKSGGSIQPETFTHGSAAQRSGAFKKGYQGGPPGCDIR